MACPDFDTFMELILEYDQKVAIDKDKDKDLRYNVWETTQEHVKNLTSKLDTAVLPDENQSPRVLRKLKNAVKRISQSIKKGGTTQADIFSHDYNIEMSIALHEVMESVKGESDKARNLGIEVSRISDSGVLPSLPMSRVAASIGRKIAFQKGFRFKRALEDKTAVVVESIYYDMGRAALQQLEDQGYVKAADDVDTIMDYQELEDLLKDFPKHDPTRSDVQSISLNEEKLGIGTASKESDYFLNRTQSDLTDTELGVITEKLRLVSQITQPQTIVLPDTEPNMSDEELAQWDDGIKAPDSKTEAARKAIYKKPLFVNKAIHSFLQLMNEDSLKTGDSATQRINQVFGNRPNMVNSLFGLKRSDNFSIDKKESIAGQNLSKTTPLDDLVEYYDLLQSEGNPSPLHMAMKIGRNARLYYLNSVLNPHASKQSRAMLTPGEYTVATGSADFDFLIYHISENLKVKGKGQVPTKKPTYKEILGGTELDKALQAYDKFQSATTTTRKMQALGPLAKQFEGIDYVTLLTTLQAVKDVRNPKGGKVTTEFTVSADATASGGTLTFIQALGTNDNVTTFLQRIGMLKGENITNPLDDLYHLMSNAITDFKDGTGEGLGDDIGGVDVTGLLEQTLDLLFNAGKDIRELSKDPTMTFIYGQGLDSATKTITRALADRIIDNLDEPNTRKYLSELFNDKAYEAQEGAELKNLKDLYPKIVKKLDKSDLPQRLYSIMKDDIKGEYLTEYDNRLEKVYNLMKKLPADVLFKILPAGAVMDGKKASNPGDLRAYGMPITKIVEVLNKVPDTEDHVLTRREKPTKTVLGVSTTHGQDAGVLYHTVADVKPEKGIVVIHDQVNGTVQDVRAMQDGYVQTAKKMASEYDVHQQTMEAIAAYSPEIAASTEFKTLKAEIDENVAEKKRIISAMFNEDTDALIGDGAEFETFSGVDTSTTTEQSATTDTEPTAEQDFGTATVTVKEDGESVEFLAQEYWDNIQSRLNMVEKLKVCLS